MYSTEVQTGNWFSVQEWTQPGHSKFSWFALQGMRRFSSYQYRFRADWRVQKSQQRVWKKMTQKCTIFRHHQWDLKQQQLQDPQQHFRTWALQQDPQQCLRISAFLKGPQQHLMISAHQQNHHHHLEKPAHLQNLHFTTRWSYTATGQLTKQLQAEQFEEMVACIWDYSRRVFTDAQNDEAAGKHGQGMWGYYVDNIMGQYVDIQATWTNSLEQLLQDSA